MICSKFRGDNKAKRKNILGNVALVGAMVIFSSTLIAKEKAQSPEPSTYTVAAVDKTAIKAPKSTLSLKKKKSKQADRRFGATYYNETFINSGSIHNSEWNNVSSFHQFKLTYKAKNGYNWSIVPTLTTKLARPEAKAGEAEQSAEATTDADDIYFALDKSRIYEFDKDLYVNMLFKAYYPVKKASRDLNSKEIRGYLWFVKNLGKGLSVEYLANPRYYWHSYRRVQEFDEGLKRNGIKGIKNFVYYQEVRAKYKFEKLKLVPYQALGGWHQFNFSAPDSSSNGDLLFIETGLEWSPLSNLWLSLALFQERDVRSPSRDFSLFDDKETSYYLQFATWY